MIAIRPETQDDIGAIHTVVRDAFAVARRSSGTEPFIVDSLRKAKALSLSFIAEEDGRIVGHVAASPVEIGEGDVEGWFGIGPLSVVPDSLRRGIGAALMRAAIEHLRRDGASGCVLLGDPEYYRRFGFVPAHPLVLPGVPPEYFQALSFTRERPGGKCDIIRHSRRPTHRTRKTEREAESSGFPTPHFLVSAYDPPIELTFLPSITESRHRHRSTSACE